MVTISEERKVQKMGFYRDSDDMYAKQRRSRALKWIATVAVSASISSGATWSLIQGPVAHRALQNQGTLQVVSGDAEVGTEAIAPSPSPHDVPTLSVGPNNGITHVVKQVEPAVMGIVNYGVVSDEFSQSRRLRPMGVGTGVLVFKDAKYGYAVTNNHVVEAASRVDVVLLSGKHVKASVVGTDPYTDLAVIRVPLDSVKNIAPARFANSDNIQPGEPAIAIGTPMGLDFADTVTAGIVSAKSRIMPVQDPQSQQTLDYQAVIQTDAAINPGNSGGPLLNIDGQIIGINSSKIVAQSFEGMGFAIPSNEVNNIAEQIMKTGHATHPALGITGESLVALPQQFWPNVPVDYGVWIKDVVTQDARSGGLQPNDVVVAINGKSVKNMADLRTYLFQRKPGDTVKLDVYRGPKKVQTSMKLSAMKSANTTEMSTQTEDANQSSSEGLNPFGQYDD